MAAQSLRTMKLVEEEKKKQEERIKQDRENEKAALTRYRIGTGRRGALSTILAASMLGIGGFFEVDE